MKRIVTALLASVLLTAFAPAPFPRTGRSPVPEALSLDSIQGTWRVVSIQRTQSNGQHTQHKWNTTGVRIQKDQWEFFGDDGVNRYGLAVDPSRKPATVDWYTSGQKEGTPRGMGIIRRTGKRLEIVYYFGGNRRAPSFEAIPDNLYLLVLER